MPPQLHFAENTLPLHLFFERFERLIDIVISHENLHWVAFSYSLLGSLFRFGCADAGDRGKFACNPGLDRHKNVPRR
jgi:hypothetical protein